MTKQGLNMPTIGFTLGDPTGIGPEVMRAAVLTLAARERDAIRVRLYLSEALLAQHGEAWPDSVTVVPVPPRTPIQGEKAGLTDTRSPEWQVGTPSLFADRCAYASLAAMVEDAAQGRMHAMITGPVAKGIFDGMVPQPPGQTEYVAGQLGVQRFAMMLAGPRLRVVPVTTHVPLRDVADILTSDRIVDATIAATTDLQRWLGVAAPRVAMCGLNPHAGEGGRLGDEEARIIAPAVARLQAEGIDVTGPLPADGLFFQALQNRWDLVVCMYHDQALGPLKTVHFYDGWNQTCGLPVPRLSPDHGTAWNIAGKGVADARSATAAVALAASIARRRA